MRPVSLLLVFALTSGVPLRSNGHKAGVPSSVQSDPSLIDRMLRARQEAEAEEEERAYINQAVQTIAGSLSKASDKVATARKANKPEKLTTANAMADDPEAAMLRLKELFGKQYRHLDAIRLQNMVKQYKHMDPEVVQKLFKTYGHLDAELLDKLVVGFSKSPRNFDKNNLHVPIDGTGKSIATVPNVFSVSRAGREATEKVTTGGIQKKITTGGIVYRERDGVREFQLVSGSSSDKPKYMLAKGTKETDEALHESAMRELMEEGGTLVKLEHQVPDVEGESSVFKPFVARSYKEYDDFPENARARVWLTEEEAIAVLQKDEMMSQAFKSGVAMLKEKGKPNDELVKERLHGLGEDDLKKLGFSEKRITVIREREAELKKLQEKALES
ncbi:hypothetical protein PsorP6_011019 [Peronosclerospora sorghi]|uniref:Uncharacterized protein n=1 Tax=Peronosclerospora sorghi TaxID=230839 RepID=A0ACC0VVM1_9STRA|nr:hypothetical protein PsorP6_011019 [Peronosclerospora sorghi]